MPRPAAHASPDVRSLLHRPQMARLVGQKKAREMWFLARMYDAQQALDMGLVNTVVPLAELEAETLAWCAAQRHVPRSCMQER